MDKKNEETQYRENLATYRNQLQEQAYTSARELDNGITIIATGALVLSIGLLDHFESVFDIWVVGLSWGFLLATLLVHLVGHYFSIRSLQQQVDFVDLDTLDAKNPWENKVTCSNLLARAFLIIGITFLAVYAFNSLRINPTKESKTPVTCICKE